MKSNKFIWKLHTGYSKFCELSIKSDKAMYQAISSYLAVSKSTGAKWTTLYELRKQIIRRKPLFILECGTGLTTIVICETINQIKSINSIYNPKFVSLENVDFYYEHALSILPDKYRNFVTIMHSDLTENSMTMFRGVKYKDRLLKQVDFIFVDGPSYKTDTGSSFCFDALDIVANQEEPLYGVIDTRVSTCFVLQKIFGRKCVKYSPISRVGRFDIRGDMINWNLSSESFDYGFFGNINT